MMASQPPRDVRNIKRKSRPTIPLLGATADPPSRDGLTEETAARALVDLAHLMASATTLADAQKTQLTVLHALLSPKSSFILEYQPVRKQLLVTAVRGRNDDRITVSSPGEGLVGLAFSTGAVRRDAAALVIPVRTASATLGCLVMLEPRHDVSDAFAAALGAQVAAAWEFAQLKDDASRRNKDLQTAIAGLKSLEKNREELLSNVSHDLKNPLTTVKAYLAMLGQGKMGTLEEKPLHAVQVAERNADRLLKMVNDLLLISRLQSGKMQLTQKPVGLKALTAEVMQTLSGTAEQAKVRFSVLHGSEVFVKGDRERMAEAIQNMLEHALLQSESEGDVDVSVSSDKGLAVLTVKDSGPGMNEEQLGQLFETFHRLPSSGGRFDAGLGLPIVAKIAQLHAGRVEASSTLGEGVALRLVLPAFAAAVSSLAEETQELRSGEILLVEDDQDCREVLQELLEQEGYRVMATPEVGEALELLSQTKPAMVLLDLRLSHEDGRSVLRHIRGTPELEDLTVYIISGASEVGSLATGTGLDRIDGFFEKPLQLQRLLDTVSSVVRPARAVVRVPPRR